MTGTDELEEGRRAMQAVMDEANAAWQAALADFYSKPTEWRTPKSMTTQTLAARWILIFAGEEWAEVAIAGLPLGHILDDLVRLYGHKLPPEMQAVRDDWYAGIVAYDMTRPVWERRTPEGREAGLRERKQVEARRVALARLQNEAKRKAEKAPLPADLAEMVDKGSLRVEDARAAAIYRAVKGVALNVQHRDPKGQEAAP